MRAKPAISSPIQPQPLRTISSDPSHVLTRTAFRLAAAVVVCVGVLLDAPSASAQCVGGGGTTNCTGDPTTFPSGGAVATPGDTTLNVNTLTNNKTVSNQIEAAYKDASAAYQQALQAQNDLNFQLGQLRDPRSPLYQSLTPAALAQATKDTENKLIAAGISVDAAKLHSDALDRSFTEAQQGYAEPQGLQALGSPAALGSDRKKFLGIACAVGLVVGAFFGVGWASLTAKRRRRRAHQWRRRAGVGS